MQQLNPCLDSDLVLEMKIALFDSYFKLGKQNTHFSSKGQY